MRRALTGAAKTARGVLLEKYGTPRLWQRFDNPVRVVDASPRRYGPDYLAWTRVGMEDGPVRWINETNFNRYYQEVPQ